jgi:putative two-component system response regulator
MSDPGIIALLIEDNPLDTRLIQEHLSEVANARVTLECADCLSAGVHWLHRAHPDVLLLDLGLPESHGLDTLSRVLAEAPGAPVVVITGLDDEETAYQALGEGAQDYLIKGRVDGYLLVRCMRYAIERKRSQQALQQSVELLQRTLEQTVYALAATIEMRDPYTAGHQRRVANLAFAIATAREMELPRDEARGLHMAGLVHDIGKIQVPAEILSKPTALTDVEWDLIKTHPQVGYDILKSIEFPWPVAQIVLQHHERLDGSGYPQGLSSTDILLDAKILAVADVVEAMASYRPYRPARPLEEALKEIEDHKGTLYDPDVVDACLRAVRDKGIRLGLK